MNGPVGLGLPPHPNGAHTPGREVGAFAASEAFAPGDLVLTEEPSIVFHLYSDNTSMFRHLDHVADACQVPRASLYCLVNLSSQPPEFLSELEASFPIPRIPLDHVVCLRFLAAGKLLADSTLLPRDSPPARYCDVLLRVRLHARTVTLPNGVPVLAMYPNSVKVQHSCDPNLLYFADGATLLYRALRPIAPGDLLTTAYIEDVELWKGTPQRQSYILQSRFYRCACRRCVAPDTARAMHCKACGNDTVVHDPSVGLWQCATPHCGREYCDAELPLSEEALLIEYILSLFTPEPDPSVDYLATLRHAHVTLGRRHWGTVLLTYLILARFWNAPPERQPRGLSKRLVVTLADALGDWFLEVMAGTVPMAKMCHFAAGILAAYGGPDKEPRYKVFDAAAQRVFAILEQ